MKSKRPVPVTNPPTHVDFLVSAIDNFGDTWFALDLAESVLDSRQEWRIRFFSDDDALFEKLTDGKPHPGISYFNLSDYETSVPSARIVSFFDRRLPAAHFEKHPFPKKILQLSYLRFDADAPWKPGTGSLNGTRYRMGNDEVIHFVPSPLDEWAGVIVRGDWNRTPEFSERPNANGAASAFYYPSSKPRIDAVRSRSNVPFAEFWNPQAEISLPFARFDEYARMLATFRANVVRWENSAVMAMLAGRPFLWDFYKETNDAHFDKIADFLSFMEPFFSIPGDFEKYARATVAFNSKAFDEVGAEACSRALFSDDETYLSAFRSLRNSVAENDLSEKIVNELAEI